MVFSKFKFKRKKGVAKLFNPLKTPLRNAWIMKNKKHLLSLFEENGIIRYLKKNIICNIT